jgi:hypothetical protein
VTSSPSGLAALQRQRHAAAAIVMNVRSDLEAILRF